MANSSWQRLRATCRVVGYTLYVGEQESRRHAQDASVESRDTYPGAVLEAGSQFGARDSREPAGGRAGLRTRPFKRWCTGSNRKGALRRVKRIGNAQRFEPGTSAIVDEPSACTVGRFALAGAVLPGKGVARCAVRSATPRVHCRDDSQHRPLFGGQNVATALAVDSNT
jgi:hypothetical protein